MPGGWDMWAFDEYGINYDVVSSQDFDYDSLGDLYDTIVISSGISTEDIVEGLDPEEHSEKYSWAYGVGEEGLEKLREFAEDGGTVLAIGNSVPTVQDLWDLPITQVLPESRDEFLAGGSLLHHDFDITNPVAWGMPESWPVWFYDTGAYELTDDAVGQVVSEYPQGQDLLASGYLRGQEHLEGAANVVSFDVGEGQVVTYGSEVTFRSLPRSSFNLLYNAIYHGPSAEVDAEQLSQLEPQFTTEGELLD